MRNFKDTRTAVGADQDHLAGALCPMSLSFGGRQCSHRHWFLPRCSTRGKLHNEFTRTPDACGVDLGSDPVDTIKFFFMEHSGASRLEGLSDVARVPATIDGLGASLCWAVPQGYNGRISPMTKNVSTFRSIVTRCLAAGVLLCLYCMSVVGASTILLAASSTTADAQGGGGHGGGFHGGGSRGGGFHGRGFRGRGWGRGGYAGPGCYYSHRRGRVIWPYY